MSQEAMKLRAAAEKVVELCSERPLSLGKWFIDMSEACESLREALAEQPAQQEPVTFLDWYDNAHWGNEDFKDGCRRAWDAALDYTSPPAQPMHPEIKKMYEGYFDKCFRESSIAERTWVGLTDKEAMQICVDCGCLSEDWLTLLDAIEAKLKEKNT